MIIGKTDMSSQANSTRTISTTTTAVSSTTLVSTEFTTSTSSVTSTVLPSPGTTTTTSTTTTTAAAGPAATFAFVLTDNQNPVNSGQFAYLGSFGPTPPDVQFVGFQKSLDGAGRFTINRGTGEVLNVTPGTQQGLMGDYNDGYHSFVIFADAAGAAQVDTDAELSCTVGPTGSLTCKFGSGPGYFYTCDGYLGIYSTPQGGDGCAFGASSSVSLTALQVT